MTPAGASETIAVLGLGYVGLALAREGFDALGFDTVYPGVTEEICGPVPAEASGLRLPDGIRLAYSPERLDRGDAEHSLDSVVKVDQMGRHVARDLVNAMLARKCDPGRAPVLVMGFTFKENCADTRNTRVADIVAELAAFSIEVDVHDPWVDPQKMRHEHGISPVADPGQGRYDAIVLAVAHTQFREMGSAAVRALGKPGAVLYDIKGVFGKSGSDLRL